MCLVNDDFVQLSRCPHGAFHLRVGNATFHLTQRQVLALRAELNLCVKPSGDGPPQEAPSYGLPADDRTNFFRN